MNSVEPIKDKAVSKEFLKRLGFKHPKYAIMYRIGIDTGLRISDILRLKASDVSGGNNLSVVEQKTKKRRLVTLNRKTRLAIDEYVRVHHLKADEFLVYSREGKRTKAVDRTQAYKVMSSISHEMGLNFVGTHSMRKTYALNKYRSHGSVNALKNDFGHKDINTTYAYLISKKKLDDLIDV